MHNIFGGYLYMKKIYRYLGSPFFWDAKLTNQIFLTPLTNQNFSLNLAYFFSLEKNKSVGYFFCVS